MKKKILFLVITTATIFSSMITGFAESVTNPQVVQNAFSFKFMLKSFFRCNSAIIVAVAVFVLFVLLMIFGKKLKRKLDKSTASQLINTFILFFSVSGIACLAMAFATDGETWSNLMHKTPNTQLLYTQFEDYIINLQSAGSQQFHETAATNTPFSLLIYFILAQFLPTNLLFSNPIVSYVQILKDQTFMYLYLILVMFCVVILYRLNRSVLRNNGLNMRDEVIAFLFAVSYPAIFCIEKGNITSFSIVLVMIFITLRGSEKNLIKELSLLAIAASAAITPYTLAFALLLFDEKSKQSALRFVRTVLYFLILFITPAVFTGFGNLLTYAKAFISVSADGFIPGNMSIVNILHFFGISNTIVIYAIILLTDAIAVLAMMMLPAMWQKTAAATYIILNVFAFSDASAAMFVFIPLVFLFAEKQHKASSWVYMLTFALLITPFPEWFKADINQFTIFLASFGISDIQNANNLISPAATQFILIILFYQIINRMKSKKLAKQETPAEQISDN